MSSKSTIFLTEDHDEHCFTDCNSPRYDDQGSWVGDDLFIEIDSRSISYRGIDDKYIILGIKAGTDIHRMLCAAGKIENEINNHSIDALRMAVKQIREQGYSAPKGYWINKPTIWQRIKSIFK